jgi:hypothetical protein
MNSFFIRILVILSLASAAVIVISASAVHHPKGDLLYENTLASAEAIEEWVMEGLGKVEFSDGWMHMYSPQEEMHHVFWAPFKHPDNFIAQWEVQNLETDAGLLILIFSAMGVDGKDIFDDALQPRDGTFQQYINGDIATYHTSYYANAAHNPDRKQTNLRKNPGFHLVQEGKEGIPTKSTEIHQVTVAKVKNNVQVFVDDRKVIDWTDEANEGDVLGAGFIGFRQMQWSHFRYRNFKIWSVKS